MGKIVDTTKKPTSYTLVSQTPPNYAANNYYINMLQHKIDRDWSLRPNRVLIEQENEIGVQEYFPIEAVIQSVKTDKGEKVSDDIKRLVFQDMKYDVRLGTRFRFSYNFDISEEDVQKDVWITTNKNSTVFTSEAVISRCNGNIGSIYVKPNGETEYHYEPVISATDLSSVGLSYSSTIVLQSSQLAIVAQYNDYTAQYAVNQRFIVGPDKVYKVASINKAVSLKAFDVTDIPIITMYLEVDESSSKDNFTTRIAHNESNEVVPVEPVEPTPTPAGDYTFSVTEPVPIPSELYSTPIEFKAYVKLNGEIVDTIPINVEITLEGPTNPEDYYSFEKTGDNTFVLYRKLLYNRSLLNVKCYVEGADSPTLTELSQTFTLSLRGIE